MGSSASQRPRVKLPTELPLRCGREEHEGMSPINLVVKPTTTKLEIRLKHTPTGLSVLTDNRSSVADKADQSGRIVEGAMDLQAPAKRI